MWPILFLKAKTPGADAHMGDLFDSVVTVKEHVTKDGTVVPMHMAHRKKKRPTPTVSRRRRAPKNPTPDLFAQPQTTPFIATHQLSDGTKVHSTQEPHVYVDASGSEYEDHYASEIKPSKPKPRRAGRRASGQGAPVPTDDHAPAEVKPAGPRGMTDLSDDEYKTIVEGAKYLKDVAYSALKLVDDDREVALRVQLGKSGRDTLLMEAYNIDRGAAHDINNGLDSRESHSLRKVDMEDAFALFPGLQKVIDEAKSEAKAASDRREARAKKEQPFDPAYHIKLVADTVDGIRRQDVERLFDNLPDENAVIDLADYLRGVRPDLAAEVNFAQRDVEEQEQPPETKADTEYRYALVNRPASLGAVPKGYLRVDKRPDKGAEHYDVARHGVIVYGRQLTQEEMRSYELRPIVDASERDKMAAEVAEGIDNHREKIIKYAADGKISLIRPSIANRFEKQHPENPSVGDFDEFVQLVASKLAAEVDSAPEKEPVAFEFGIPEGTTKGKRKAWNKAALQTLRAHVDGQPWTDAEKAALARYSGQGGVGDSLNEYYTRNDVATATWSVVQNLGIEIKTALEPSCGNGVFLHTKPKGVDVVAVDLDPISSQIASILHGGEVHTQSFERFALDDAREFDVVVGNPPYGPRGMLLGDDKKNLATAEQYFLDTCIDKSGAGGVVAMVVPSGILDSKTNRAFRDRLARKSVFLGAFRLPASAFAHSHTNVTTDIVVFRVRPKDVAGALSVLSPAEFAHVADPQQTFVDGKYFAEDSTNIFGAVEPGWRAKAGMGNDITVTGSMEGVADAIGAQRLDPREDQLALDVQGVLAGVQEFHTAKGTVESGVSKQLERVRRAALKRNYDVAKPGDTKSIDGVLYRLEGDPPRWHRLDAEEELPQAVRDANDILPLLSRLAEMDKHGTATDSEREVVRRRVLDFIDAHGNPNDSKDLAREVRKAGGKGAGRALYRLMGAVDSGGNLSALLTGERREGVEQSLEAVAERLALKFDGFTQEQLGEAWQGGGDDPTLLSDTLFASDRFALEADGKTWVLTEQYLTGDMWKRLDAAQEAVAHEGLALPYKRRYEQQIKLLTDKINPGVLEDAEIDLRSPWIPVDILGEWLESRRQAGINDPADGARRAAWDSEPITIKLEGGVYTMTGSQSGNRPMILKYLNRLALREADDKPVIDRLSDDFREWLLTGPRREYVEDLYNRMSRGYEKPAYSDAPMDIPGLNPEFSVNPYHFAGLRWAIAAGKGIIAADVGVGKTIRGLMLGALGKAQGKRKPTYVVPKSVLATWVIAANQAFPGAKVLTIGEEYQRDEKGQLLRDKDNKLISKQDSAREKERKLAMLAQNDYDFVFMSMPVWSQIDLSPAEKKAQIDNDFWTQRGDTLGQAGDKRLRTIRENYDQSVAKRDFENRSGAVFFEDLGIDMLIMDEAHAVKNLYAIRSRWGDSPKFLGGGGLSALAQDTDLKAAYFRAHNNNAGIYGLTATPTKNSPLEVYSMLHHFAPEEFERLGIKNSEQFIDMFVEFEHSQYLGLNGEIEDGLVCSGFKSLDVLRPIMARYIDRTTAADVKLRLPKPEAREHFVDMDDNQKAIYATIREDALASARGETDGDHIFRIIDKMSKAALDPTLLEPDGKRQPAPKIAAAVKTMLAGSKDGGQVVFCDYNDAHDRIKDELVAAGVDPSRIGIVNATRAKTAAQRESISDKFNKGKLDFVIGNTATMGEGMNLQTRTTDIHHLDMPWEPASVQQRNGRGLRQGNTNEGVRIHTYLAKGSFDGYRWQTLTSKKNWMDLLWSGGNKVENLARQQGFSTQDMQIMLSADPDAEKAKLKDRLEAAQAERATQKRAEAAAKFVSVQKMRATYAALKDKGTRSAEALSVRIQRDSDQLRSNPEFKHADSLKSGELALLHPVTGDLLKVGAMIKSGDERNVITHINVMDGTMRVRPWGESATRSKTVKIGVLTDADQVAAYSPDEERNHIARERTVLNTADAMSTNSSLFAEASVAGDAVAGAVHSVATTYPQWYATEAGRAHMTKTILGSMAKHKSPIASDEKIERAADMTMRANLFAAHGAGKIESYSDIKSLSPETVSALGDELHKHVRAGLASYRFTADAFGKFVPTEKADSRNLVASYKMSKLPEGERLMLPTAENRQVVVKEAVAAELRRELTGYYPPTRRRGGYVGNGPAGVEAEYVDADGVRWFEARTNPWVRAGEVMYGDDIRDEVRAGVRREVDNRLSGISGKRPEDVGRVLAAASLLVEPPSYGGQLGASESARDMVFNKLKELGALNTMQKDLGNENYHLRRLWGLTSTTLPGSTLKNVSWIAARIAEERA